MSGSPTRYDLTVEDDHRANRTVARPQGQLRFLERLTHEEFMVERVDVESHQSGPSRTLIYSVPRGLVAQRAGAPMPGGCLRALSPSHSSVVTGPVSPIRRGSNLLSAPA